MAICGTAIRPYRSLFRLSAAMSLEYDMGVAPKNLGSSKHMNLFYCGRAGAKAWMAGHGR
jgi:hypothetical protein